MHRIALAVTDGMSPLDLAGPCEVFGIDRSNVTDPWYDFLVCGARGTRVAQWFRLETSHGFDDILDADTVIVPGWTPTAEAPAPPEDLVDAVRTAHAGGARVVSMCTGAFVLAAAGILDGRRIAIHWAEAERFTSRHPEVPVEPGVPYVDHGDVVTVADRTAGIDASLHIVRDDHGAAVADAVARDLVTAPRGDWDGSLTSVPLIADASDRALLTLLSWVDLNLDLPFTVANLARRANMSTRNLTRHFHSVVGTPPLQWLSTRRLQRAKELLGASDASIETIARRVGLGSAATLRRHFNRVIGVTPDTYRRTVRAGTCGVGDVGCGLVEVMS